MIRLRQLSLYQGSKELFQCDDVTIYPGWRTGICGANGCGKSSLLSLLLGLLHQDRGDLELPAKWKIATVDQQTPAVTRTALDYVLDGDKEYRTLQDQIRTAEEEGAGERLAHLHADFEAIDGYHSPVKAEKLLAGLGFSVEQLQQEVKHFSGGWRMRLNLARALLIQSDLLLLDEPTNHLDLESCYWLQDWLLSYPGTLLLISHDREFLDVVTDHTLNIEQQQLRLFSGNYTLFERQRAEQMAQQQVAYDRQQRDKKSLQEFINRFRAKASKAKQAQSRIKMLEKMQDLLPAHADSPFQFTLTTAKSVPNPLYKMEQGVVGYADTPLISDVNLLIKPGDRIALLGHNGAGKSTLIKTLAGDLPLLGGEVSSAQDLQIGYFAQHQLEQLDLEGTPLLHIQRLAPDKSEQQLRDFLGSFGFQGDQALGVVNNFSGGEKSRLVLALLAWQRPHLLLLDEPTNHLDLEMRHALTMAIQEFEGAIVVISHDRFLLRSVVDHFYLVDSGNFTEFSGDLDNYHQWLREQPNSTQTKKREQEGSTPSRKDLRRIEAEKRLQLQPLTRRLKELEKIISKEEAALQMLDVRLGESEIYQPQFKDELTQLLREQGGIKSKLEEAESAWFEVSESLEAMQEAG